MSAQQPGRTLVVRVLAAVLIALVPVIALSLSTWSAATGLLVLGIIPTLSAAAGGPRAMAVAASGSVATALVAVLVANTGPLTPWLGTALVVVLSLVTGALAVRGLHPVGAATISFAAYVLVDPSSAIDVLDASLPAWGSAGLVAGGVLSRLPVGDRSGRPAPARCASAHAGRHRHAALRRPVGRVVRAVHPGLCALVHRHQRLVGGDDRGRHPATHAG